jgi:hypothetical protein
MTHTPGQVLIVRRQAAPPTFPSSVPRCPAFAMEHNRPGGQATTAGRLSIAAGRNAEHGRPAKYQDSKGQFETGTFGWQIPTK